MKPNVKPCKWCGDLTPNHWPFQCFENPKRKKYRLPKEGKVAFAMKETRNVWFRENPPDKNGFYHCYLNISALCPKRLLPSETTLDHLLPKGSHPKLRYELTNLFPCCGPCNILKGSRSLTEALKLKTKKAPL